MNKEVLKNNNVNLSGTLISKPEYSHEVCGERFYNMFLEVNRKSGVADVIPLMISERLFDVSKDCVGTAVDVYGQFRSFNRYKENKNRLILSVFVLEIEQIISTVDKNNISIIGYICKQPTYRNTPQDREISDLLVAVNRSYRKSDYIPCICWGRNARFTSELAVGTKLKLIGRIQSREYIKKYEDGIEEQRTAYEVSASKIEVVKDGEE